MSFGLCSSFFKFFFFLLFLCYFPFSLFFFFFLLRDLSSSKKSSFQFLFIAIILSPFWRVAEDFLLRYLLLGRMGPLGHPACSVHIYSVGQLGWVRCKCEGTLSNYFNDSVGSWRGSDLLFRTFFVFIISLSMIAGVTPSTSSLRVWQQANSQWFKE